MCMCMCMYMAFQNKMKVTSIFILFSFFLFASSVYGSSIAKHYIVYMGLHSLPDSETVINSNHEMLSSVVGSVDEAKNAIVHHYHKSFRGFSAMLKPEEAEQLRNHSSVVSVFESITYQLQTTRSWDFLMDHTTGFGRGQFQHFRGSKKHDVVVGHFDSGVWPESRSFSDSGLGPVPESFKGECIQGDEFTSDTCNRKIVGARYYADGYEAKHGPLDDSGRLYYRSARDDFGHGSQTASVAVGAEVSNITLAELSKLTARGGAPHARLAVYKSCWFGYCVCSDILQAFDDAIYDRVNLIGFSGGPPRPLDYFEDCFAIGSYHAFQNGIVVVGAAGNSGNGNGYGYASASSYGSVVNGAPWIFTVAASSIDREFVNSVNLPDRLFLRGHASNEHILNGSHPLIAASHAARRGISVLQASYCNRHTLNPSRVKRKIVVCRMKGWEDDRKGKSEEVNRAGGIGMVIIDQGDSAKLVEDFSVPTSIVDQEQGRRLLDYMSRKWRPKGTISPTKTQFNTRPAPKMAFFSSKGPNRLTPDIIKPDLTAPGFNVLAAWPPAPHKKSNEVSYAFRSGTSMSAPHVLGVAAVIKATNKRWSPAIIKSALMTTASLLDNTRNPIQAGDDLATPFDFGSGHLEPNLALTPGLVYDWSSKDLIDFLCYQTRNEWKLQHLIGRPVGCKYPRVPPYQLNYPSIAISKLDHTISVYRTATFVATRDGSQVYTASIEHPEGVHVRVKPSVLDFTDGTRKITYRVDLIPEHGTHGAHGYSYGSITWSDGSHHHVRSPIVVKVVKKHPEHQHHHHHHQHHE